MLPYLVAERWLRSSAPIKITVAQVACPCRDVDRGEISPGSEPPFLGLRDGHADASGPRMSTPSRGPGQAGCRFNRSRISVRSSSSLVGGGGVATSSFFAFIIQPRNFTMKM